MEATEIAKKYKEQIESEFSTEHLTLILYGSTVYGINTSDLDMCFICDGSFDRNVFEKLKEITLKFHMDNHLRVDQEIAYEDKLVYPKNFVISALEELPFPIVDGRYIVQPIEKTKDFLASDQMKKRLILNILTVKREVLFGDESMVDSLSQRAWENIIKVVTSYCQLSGFEIDEFVTKLYTDPFNGNQGEMYLGYKNNLEVKRIFLTGAVQSALKNLERQKKVVKRRQFYIPNKNWLCGK